MHCLDGGAYHIGGIARSLKFVIYAIPQNGTHPLDEQEFSICHFEAVFAPKNPRFVADARAFSAIGWQIENFCGRF
jgi:hypothetical protein